MVETRLFRFRASLCDVIRRRAWLFFAASLAGLTISAPARCNIRSLRIRPGGTVSTAPAAGLPVNGDMTLRVLLKRNPWDLVAHEILSMQDVDGNRRFSLAVNTSPWALAYFSDHGWQSGTHRYGGDGAVPHGCPSGTTYEDWWMVYQAPTPTSAGYFRLYRDGVVAHLDNDITPYNFAIPAGTNMNWKGKDLMLRIGDENPLTMVDYQVLDVCWWTAAMTDADVAAINNRQIASIADDAVRHLSDIYWYVRPSNTYPDHLTCELGACVGNTARDAAFAGDVSYSVDTPRDAGWEIPDDVSPPDPGPAPLSVTATDSGLTADVQPGSSQTASRTLVVSAGVLWPYSGVSQEQFGAGGIAQASVTGLKPGTTYYVTGQWADASGNVAIRQVPVRTTGTSGPITGPTHALHFTNGGEAITALDAAGKEPLFIRMPYDSDATIRLLLRSAPTMTGPCWFFCQRADAAGAYGYARFAIGLDYYGKLTARVNDGQQTFEAKSTERVSSTSFDEVWVVYSGPTRTTDGSLQLYKGSVLKASTVIPAGTDMTWKKWDAQFVLGGYADGIWNGSVDYEMLEPAWWTKAMSPAEMAAISGHPLFSLPDSVRQTGYLYWYARPHLANGVVEPDLGASIDTALTRQKSGITFSTGSIAPLFESNTDGTLTYSDDVPAGFGGLPYTLTDVVDALVAAGGMARANDSFPRLNIANSGDSATVLDISDAVAIARSMAGLAS